MPKRVIYTVIVLLFVSLNSLLANSYHDNVWKVKYSGNDRLVLSYNTVISGISKVSAGNINDAVMPDIKNAVTMNLNPGAPALKYALINIAVPSSDGFETANFRINSEKKVSGVIAPVAGLVRNGEISDYEYTARMPEYQKYDKKRLSPTLDYIGIARSSHTAQLAVCLTSYNMSDNQTSIITGFEIEVIFTSDASHKAPSNTKQDNPFLNSFINKNAAQNWLIENSDMHNNDYNDKNNKNYNNKNNNHSEKNNNSDINNNNSDRHKTKPRNQFLSDTDAKWFKIAVESEGIYKITASELSKNGANIPTSDIQNIKLFGNGGKPLNSKISTALQNEMTEQPIIVKTNSSGALESIIFYAAAAHGFAYDSANGFYHYINPYSEKNHYLLTWGGEAGKRAVPEEAPAQPADHNPSTYQELLFEEQELENAFINGSGTVWFGTSIFPANYTNVLHNLDRSGNITYRFSMAHRATERGDFDIYENNNLIAELSLNPCNTSSYQDAYRRDVKVEYPADIISSDNRSNLKFVYSNPLASGATAFFDWYEIQYPRSFNALNNQLAFYTDPEIDGIAEYKLNYFTGDIYGFDVSDPANPILLKNTASTGGMFIFKTAVDDYNPKRFFISSNIKNAVLEEIEMGSLRTEHLNTDVIVITHQSLLNSARKYIDYRNSQGELSYSLVRTDHIFKEFSSANVDPTAIRDYLAFAYENWEVKPKYVVLWGDGHYEYTPRYSLKSSSSGISTEKYSDKSKTNLVIPFESTENNNLFDATISFSSDDYYVRIVGDDRLIDMSIGRLTIDSDEVGLKMLEKIKHYENNSSSDMWRSSVTLVADDSPRGNSGSDGPAHTHQTEALEKYHIPDFFQRNKIYLVEYPTENIPGGKRKPRVMEDILNNVNTSGALILNYIGHGNPRVWAHEEVFERSLSVPQMKNWDKLFFVSAATCDFGRYDMPDLRSGAEELLLSDIGGAIAVFAATRVVYSGDNAEINGMYYDYMLYRDNINNEYVRMGDALYNVKQYLSGTNDEKFQLIGDPTMKLLIPEYQVRIDSVNGVFVGDSEDTVQLNALSDVRISGTVVNPQTQSSISDFNGTVVLTTLDCSEDVIVEDTDGSRHYITKQGSALNRSSYNVVDGKFTADFIIPLDISFCDNTGIMYAYAFSDDSLYAAGDTKSFTLGGINPDSGKDTLGPEIQLYLDSRSFNSGDVVSSAPLLIVDLFDSSGINTTGKGIGHRIEAWINDEINSIDLTNNFSNSLEDSRAGVVEKILYDLEPGSYRIKVRAWDVYNNFSTEQTEFIILPADGDVYITNLLNYPNPFENSTTVKFQHNASLPFQAELTVYNAAGEMAAEYKAVLNTALNSEFQWQSVGTNNRRLPSGTYYYRLFISTNDGRKGNKTGIMVVLK